MITVNIHTPFFIQALGLGDNPEHADIFTQNKVLPLTKGVSINASEIAQAIKKHKIFPDILDNARDKLVASVAWLISNPNEDRLRVPVEMSGNNVSLNEQSWISLKANLYREEAWLSLAFHDEAQLELFKNWLIAQAHVKPEDVQNKIGQPSHENELSLEVEHDNHQIDLAEITRFFPDLWSSPEHIFSQLQNIASLNNLKPVDKENYQRKIFTQVKEELWQNTSFVIELLTNYDASLPYLPDNIIKDKNFREILTSHDLAHAWYALYERVYFDICEKDKTKAYAASSWWNFSKEEKDEFVYQCSQWFNDKKLVINIIDAAHRGTDLTQFYHDLPEELQLDVDIICPLSKNVLTRNIRFDLSQIHDDFFKAENLDNIIALCQTRSINNLPEELALKIFGSWMNDKKSIIKVITDVYEKSSAKTINFAMDIYKHLPEKMKYDGNVIAHIIQRAPRLYEDLPQKMKENQIVIAAIFSRPNFLHVLDKDFLLAQTDTEVIRKLLTDNINLIHDAPEHWKTNGMLMASQARHLKSWIKEGYITQEVYEHIYASHDAVIELLSQKPEEYKNMPAALKAKESLALLYLDKLDENLKMEEREPETASEVKAMNEKHALQRRSALKNIPDELWNKENFCVRMIGRNAQGVGFIPKPFWTQKSFLLKVAREMDMQKITLTEAFLPEKIDNLFVQIGASSEKNESSLKKLFLKINLEKDLPHNKNNNEYQESYNISSSSKIKL